MNSSQIGIVFEQLENSTVLISSIDEFIQAHNGLRQLSSRMVSFEDAEDPNYPLKFVWADNQKYPRYKVHINLSVPTELKKLNEFLERKKFYWMISSVFLYADGGPNARVRTITKCRHFFEHHYELIWGLATTQLLAVNGIQPNTVQNVALPVANKVVQNVALPVANNALQLPPPPPPPNFADTSICRCSSSSSSSSACAYA